MSELTFLLDPATGAVLLEGPERAPTAALLAATDLLGTGDELGCARPTAILPPPAATPAEIAVATCVRLSGYYHQSLVEGPGRRTSALFQSCPLQCRGCWTPHLHDPDGGALVPVDRLADALLDPAYPRDGISLLGGEPFAQPDGLLALVLALRARGCPHILIYSGHTYEHLLRRARRQPAVGAILGRIDMLVDGPYVERLAASAGPWTGSGNQRVLTLRAGVPVPPRSAADHRADTARTEG